MGRPVVATDAGGNRELVEDGKTGFIVPLGNPEALAEAIIHLLRDPQLAQSMGQKAKEKAVNQLSLERYANEYQNIYEIALKAQQFIKLRQPTILPNQALKVLKFYYIKKAMWQAPAAC